MKKTKGLRNAAWLLLATMVLLALITVFMFDLIPLGAEEAGENRIPISDTSPVSNKTFGSSGKATETAEWLLDVPYISQKGLLPTGCEIVSALMVLHYYGYDITADQFVDNYLDKGDFYTDAQGQLFGVHPARAFVGDPRTENGYGCYAPVIVNSLNRILKSNQRAKALTGTKLETLLENYVKKGTPVLVWASIEMRQPSAGTSWTVKDTGEKFTWIRQEHCMVLVGYDRNNYYFNDPYNGNGIIGYNKYLVETRFEEMGMQSVVILES